MEAKELRIGNWINDEDGCENEVTSNWFSWMAWDYCTGIPLTEEWLVTFGFEKSQILYDDYFYIQIQDKFLKINVDGRCFYGAGDIGYTHLPYIIESVHQLQNLYFALTGHELHRIK